MTLGKRGGDRQGFCAVGFALEYYIPGNKFVPGLPGCEGLKGNVGLVTHHENMF